MYEKKYLNSTQVWGIDVSTHAFAIASVDVETGELVSTWQLSAPTKLPTEERLHILFTLLNKEFQYMAQTGVTGTCTLVHLTRPVLIGVEQANHTRNAQTQWLLSEAVAFVIAAAYLHDINLHRVHNLTWKSHLAPVTAKWARNREGQKALVAQTIRDMFPTQITRETSQDEIDATGIALYTRQVYLNGAPEKKKKPRKPRVKHVASESDDQ